MNPRRIHDLMREHFPPVLHAEHDWTLVQDERGSRLGVLSGLLSTHVRSEEVVVEVHRRLGAVLPLKEALAYISTHIGQGEIRIADRAFSGFVVVAANGVATGWRAPANPSLQPTAFSGG